MTRILFSLFFTSFILHGCKKHDAKSDDDEVITIKGIIKLPDGMIEDFNGCTINSYRTEQVLTGNAYEVSVSKNDYNVQYLTDGFGTEIMMGLSYPGQQDHTLDAKSTLLGLVMKLPAINTLTAPGKLNFMAKLRNVTGYGDALLAVENHIRSGKDIFDTTDIAMRAQISQLFDQAALRSGFGYNGQVYVTQSGNILTVGNSGVSFAQVAGIYSNGQRIGKLDIDRYKFFVNSIAEIPSALSTPPSPIEQAFSFPQDGIYEVRIRNGGFNPVTNDAESEDAIILNGVNLVLDNIKVFLPVDVSKKCPSAIYNIVKAKISAYKNVMKVTSDKTQFLALIYNLTLAALAEIKLSTDCSAITVEGNKFIDKLKKYLKWLDLVGKVGTNLNNTTFALEYFNGGSGGPRSALDTTIVVGNPLLGKWKISAYFLGNGSDYFNSAMPLCQKDNVITYSPNSKVAIDEGALKCDPTDPQVVSATYILSSNGVNITTYAGNEGDDLDDLVITFLSSTTLKLRDLFANNVITYTKQP